MAAKATITDLKDAGFREKQFGTPGDFETANTGYLARHIAIASAWARERYGASAYDALADVAAIAYVRLRRAEVYKTSAELWRARCGFVDTNAVAGREGFAYLDRRECLAHADGCDALAEVWLQAAINGTDVPPGSGVSIGLVETGRFPPTVTGATVPA